MFLAEDRWARKKKTRWDPARGAGHASFGKIYDGVLAHVDTPASATLESSKSTSISLLDGLMLPLPIIDVWSCASLYVHGGSLSSDDRFLDMRGA